MDECTLESIMDGINAEVLKKMARTLKIGKAPTRKAEVLAAIAERIRTDPDAILRHCSDGEKKLLAEAAFGGPVNPTVFRGKYGLGLPARPNQYRDKMISPFYALACSDYAGDIIVASEVAGMLRQRLPEPEPVTVATVDELPQVHTFQTGYYSNTRDEERPIRVHEGERRLFPELRQVLSLARGGGIGLTAKGGAPTGASARKLGEALVEPDFDLDAPEEERGDWYDEPGPVRAYAWGVLVQACGWCRAKGGRLEPTRAGVRMLSGGPEEFRKGVMRFIKDSSFDELRRINHIRGQTGKAQRSMVAVSSRRATIVEAMGEWPVGRWIRLEDAYRFQLASGNLFSVTRSEWDLYFSEKHYGSLGNSGAEGSLERQYMRAFLFESMGTLGLVDVAYVRPHSLWPEFRGEWGTDDLPFCGRYDGLLYVRLNELGAFCLGGSETYEIPPLAQSKLYKALPNMDLVLNVPAPGAGDIATLEMFAEPTAEKVWRISRKAILSQLERGGSMVELREMLRQHAENDLPATVTTFLEDIERKAASIRSVEEALLIDCEDPATAGELASDPGARKYCLRAGERHLVVGKKNERAFRSAVRRAGYVLPP